MFFNGRGKFYANNIHTINYNVSILITIIYYIPKAPYLSPLYLHGKSIYLNEVLFKVITNKYGNSN